MPQLTDAQKVMRNDTGQDIAEQIRLLRLQMKGGGLPAGGAAGMIPVKTSAADYVAEWQYPQYSRPNLLDNWYFVGGGSQSGDGVFPINQRGQTVYNGAGTGIDRWSVTSGASSSVTIDTVNADGVVFKNTVYSNRFSQIAPPSLAGQTLTLSALATGIDGERFCVTFNTDNAGNATGNFVTAGLATVTFTVPASATGIRAQIRCENSGASVKIHAMKLEIGSYQTLAHNEGTDESPNWVLNELPDFGEELTKCQRHHFKLPDNPRFPASFRTTGAIYFSIYLPVTMHSGAKLFAPNMIGIFAYINGVITEQTGFSFDTATGGGITPYANGSGDGIFTVRATKTIHGLLGSPGIELRLGSGAYLSAE